MEAWSGSRQSPRSHAAGETMTLRPWQPTWRRVKSWYGTIRARRGRFGEVSIRNIGS